MHQVIFSSVKLAKPHVDENGKYKTSEFIDVVKYGILERLFEVQNNNADYGTLVLCLDDTHIKNWRRDIYSKYKSSRKKTRDESPINYHEVFIELNKMLDVLKTNSPWKVISVYSAEGDDLLLCLSKAFAQSEKILIISSDKDLIQAQKFGDVTQYSLLTSKFITPETKGSETLDDWIMQHIILGDDVDQIPKVTDSTEFSSSFKEFLTENNLNYTELDFDQFSDTEIENITMDFDDWKLDRSGNKVEKNIFKDMRLGPTMLKKKIEEFGSIDNFLQSNPLYYLHYQRNKKLISIEGIPESIYNTCLINFKSAKTDCDVTSFREYLVQNNLGRLIASLPSAFTGNRVTVSLFSGF